MGSQVGLASAMDIDSVLNELHQPQSLSILKLASPYLSNNNPAQTSNNRNSDRSSTERAKHTPAILAADLAHYQELFSKLRFSYVEQVTKERFLRAITAEQPEFVDPSENVELENQLKQDKAQLKERKVEVRELITELEEQGRQLAHRYENIQLQTKQLEELPAEIANLESTISTLQESQEPQSEDPALNLPLQPTLELLSERERQLADLDRQIATLQEAIPRKQNQIAGLQDEVASLNVRKIKAIEEAQQARRRKANGGAGDELDEKGRWLRSVDAGLKMMLEV